MLGKQKEKVVKNIFLKPKEKILTPELEREIRENERIEFAKSFNFQCLFISDDQSFDWLKWVSVVNAVLLLIILIIKK